MDIMAYLCGLIAADGHVSKGEITIAQKDKRYVDLLVALMKNAGLDVRSVFYDAKAGVWKIKIKDAGLYNYVIANGIPPGKKAERILPPKLEGESALWYIVGFIDGDGWVEQVVKTTRHKAYYLRIGVKTKSRELRDWMCQVLESRGIKTNKADKKDGYEIHIDRAEAWLIASLLLNPYHRERASRIADDRLSSS